MICVNSTRPTSKRKGTGLIKPGDASALRKLKEAAAIWRAAGRCLNSGYAMSLAIHAAWGNGEEINNCFQAALEDYRKCVNIEPANSHEALAALISWTGELNYAERSVELTRLRTSLQTELAQRLLEIGESSPHKIFYFVRGVVIATDFSGPWEPLLPGNRLEIGIHGGGSSGISVTFGSHSQGTIGQFDWIAIPGAFRLLLSLGDYQGAYQIITSCPEEFQYVNLKGWPPAIEGLLKIRDPLQAFTEAANSFAEDTFPGDEEGRRRRGNWSGENIYLWAKYFRALAAIEGAKV